MHFNRLISFILVSLISFSLLSQARDFNPPSKTKPPKNTKFEFDPDNLVIGGSLGAVFGNVTLIDVAPSVGYLLTDNYLVGISARYMYYEDRTYAPAFIYKTNIYGGGVFNQYFFLENFLAHAEYELLNLDSPININKRINLSSFFVGGGYRSSLGGNSYASILVLFNLNDSAESPYTNPIIRVGFGIGLY